MDILPDSRCRESKGNVVQNGETFVRIFCANCGADGGGVPEEHTTFAFYLCNDCVDKHGPPAGLMAVPDEVFWARVQEAMIEEHGRLLSNEETAIVLDDPNSKLSKLAREAPKGR